MTFNVSLNERQSICFFNLFTLLYIHVYVADTGNNRIQKFDSNGNFITMWGSPGKGGCEFIHPEDVAVDANDHVYVADTGNNHIQVFFPS